MAIQGDIGPRVKGIVPIVYDALLTDARFGEPTLQARIDLVKEALFGEVVPPEDEVDEYPVLVREYAAKLIAIELLGAGIDLFRDAPLTKNTSGSNEIVTWEDRLENMRKHKMDLIAETRGMAPDVLPLIDYTPQTHKGVPLLSTMETELLTPDPTTFPRPYAPV